MYNFTLQLPDGSRSVVSVTSEPWQWHGAFTEACRIIESKNDLPARSGIRCIDYTWDFVSTTRAA